MIVVSYFVTSQHPLQNVNPSFNLQKKLIFNMNIFKIYQKLFMYNKKYTRNTFTISVQHQGIRRLP